MRIRAEEIGADLKEAVDSHIRQGLDSTKDYKRALNNFARECDIQPLQMQLWLKGAKRFREDSLERIGLNLSKQTKQEL